MAWSTASLLPSFSKREFGFNSSNPACLEDFLRAKAMAAVIEDDAETLQNCLTNGNLDVSETFHPLFDRPDYSCFLLHVAATKNAASSGQILLDSDCDLNAPDSDGNLPIHLCFDNESTCISDLFIQKGASLLATDSCGKNMWHIFYLSYRNIANHSLMERLFELNQDQTSKAMLARTHSGETPLLLALKWFHVSSSTAARLLPIIDHCAWKPQFWEAHGPVFAAAAEFGSEVVIEHLIQAGAEPDLIGDGNFTPLHELGDSATPACAQTLKRINPDAHKLRFQGLTPLEKYIEKVMKFGRPTVDQELLAVLATPEALSSQNMDGGTVWSFCCKETLTRSLSGYSTDQIFSHLDSVISSLLRLGALISYEELKRESGILPLFSALGLESQQTELRTKSKFRTTSISCRTLSAVILESAYWDDGRRSPAAVSFLKKAVRDRNLEAVELVLQHGLSVHQRVDQISSIEFAVSHFKIAHEIMTSDEEKSKEIMIALLSHAVAEEMKEYSPHGLGLGKTHTYWLLRELIGWGVDFNGEAKFAPGCTPLVHHLSRRRFETAEILLDLGAIPSAHSADGHTAVHYAASSDQAVTVNRLHDKGASLDMQSHDESTALNIAVRNKCLSAAKILLEFGVKSLPDAVAMTPRMYASSSKNEDMIKLLDQYLPLDANSPTFVDAQSIPWKCKKYLAQSFEDAIEKDDLEECQRLHGAGFSLDTYMSSFSCSPLIGAIASERLRIVDWLLQRKATTLGVTCKVYSTIEIAMAYASLSPILKRLLTLYIEQGGDILSDDHHPLEWAIMYHNEEGLRVFLDFVKAMTERTR